MEPQLINKNLHILFISAFIDLLGFTTILPLFPSILAYYEKNDTSETFISIINYVKFYRSSILNAPEIMESKEIGNISLDSILLGGLLGSIFSLLQCLSAPIFTKYFDNQKIAIIISLFGSILSSIVWYNSKNFLTFLMARILGGLFEGNITITLSILSKLSNKKLQKISYACIGICYSLAFIIGPLIGVYLSKILLNKENFYQVPAIFTASCSFFSLILIATRFENLNFVKSDETIVKQKSKHILYSTYFLHLMTFSGIEFSLGFLFLQIYNIDRRGQGKIYSIMGLIMAFIQASIVRKFASRYLIIISALILSISFLIMTIKSLNFLYFALFLKAISAGCMVPSFNTCATELKLDIGRLRSVGAFARGIGPVTFCSIYWIFGSQYCYLIGSILMTSLIVLLQSFDFKNKFD